MSCLILILLFVFHIELPNLLDEAQMKVLKEWNGELRFLQNFKLVRLGKKHLQDQSSDITMDCLTKSTETSKEMSSKLSVSNEDDCRME